VGAVLAGSFAVLWHETRADTLMARIQHSRILCANGMQTLSIGPASSALPTMIALDLEESPDGLILAHDAGHALPERGTRLLRDVLAWAQHEPHVLLMLNMRDIEPAAVTALVRKARMVERVIVNAPDCLSAEAALRADPNMMVAIPVSTVREERRARAIAHAHPYAIYLKPDASAGLFAMAHRDADAVITSAIGLDADGRDSLIRQPIDILITDSVAAR
jgi:hypothetical protein